MKNFLSFFTFFFISFLLSTLFSACSSDAGDVDKTGSTETNPTTSELRFDPEKYLEKLPEEESINASLYNYELILNQVRSAYSKKEFFKVLSNYNNYVEIFEESRVDDESEINYWVGKTILELTQNKHSTANFLEYLKGNLRESLKENSQLAFRLSVKKDDARGLTYDKTHFKQILTERNNYFFEKKALKETYLDGLTQLEKNNRRINNKNFNHLYFLVTRYPDFLPYTLMKGLFENGSFIQDSLLSKNQKERLGIAENILEQFNLEKHEKNIGVSHSFTKAQKIFFSAENEAIVRSRTHPIASRNLERLELWQPFVVLYSLKGEDAEDWLLIEYAEGYQGFIRADLKKKEFDLASDGVKDFFMAYQFFLNGEYVKVMEVLSPAIKKQNLFLRERSITLMNQTVAEIGRRATSLNSVYTKFALQYPAFFSIYEKEWYLESSDNLLFFLLEQNFDSRLIQYFDGFDAVKS